VDRLEAGGVTWKAYMEDMPSNCYALNSGDYAVRHNPFVYYKDIATNASRCARVIPSGNSASVLLNDLGSTTTASNYMWFTPNNCNNMHSCRESIGDTYMSILVPKILSSTIFQTTRAALLITFDEGYGFPTYVVWAGPVAKTSYASSYGYTHYSVLATIESNWNLSSLTSNDRDAPHMGEFFLGQPSRGFRDPPPHPLALAYVATISGVGGAAVIVTGVILLRREKRRSSD
jgi:acid phosphatase